MKRYAFLLMILSAQLCYASEEEIYVVQRPDGVSIVHYLGGNKSLESVLKDSGLEGLPYSQINEINISRADRKYWKLQKNEIVLDSAKKQADQNEHIAKRLEKASVLEKLNISKEEFEMIKNVE